jgi:hypothetical protein
MAGDFGQIARYMEREAEAFVERLGIIPGMKGSHRKALV